MLVEALRGVSFDVHAGEYVAVMGESGSGKTTLLGILGCLDRPTDGSYQLVGQEMASLPEAPRAHVRGERIGFVFQAYNLLPRSTAFQNVELPLVYTGIPKRERQPRVLEALEAVGLAGRADHHPNQLSGGQQQRVAIARALVTHPSVVLADEPTGNLDSSSAEEVLTILGRLHGEGATIVIVTHSDDVGERAPRILRMADGLLVGDLECPGRMSATLENFRIAFGALRANWFRAVLTALGIVIGVGSLGVGSRSAPARRQAWPRACACSARTSSASMASSSASARCKRQRTG